MTLLQHLQAAQALLDQVQTSPVLARVDHAVETVAAALRGRRPLLVCGNGGSAADAMHITGELVGRFLKERPGLKCICLSDNPVTMTAWSNDYSYETVFSRQVEAYGEAGGVVWGISTSGNSANVVEAFRQARSMGMTTLAMTGEGGGRLAGLSDILIDVPARRTPDIQQVHLVLYHYICERVEALCAD